MATVLGYPFIYVKIFHATNSLLIVLIVIPIQGIMLYLRPSSIQHPIELHLNVLDEVTSNLNVTNVRRVVLWSDIIMLYKACGVKIGYERGCGCGLVE